jgi:hypothetical protein
MKSMKRWSFDDFGVVTKELESIIRKRMEELGARIESWCTSGRSDQTQGANGDELLYWEEMMWLQRSCLPWLKEGDDCNTKFFHQKAAVREKK